MAVKLEIGSVVEGRYEVLRPLSEGGMGSVFRARDRQSGRDVALKQMLHDRSDWDEETRRLVNRRFAEEAEILLSLSHPGIPEIQAHFVSGDDHYIVMELVEGDSLDRVVADYVALTGRPVPLDLALDWGIQVCNILEYLHTREPWPIIHRDVKPGNIIRKPSRGVALVDFGLARGVRAGSLSPMTLVGTVGYAPVEQFQGQAEPRSDLFGLAATLHHLISGVPPVPFAIPRLRELVPHADPDLDEVLARALSQDLDERPPTAAAFQEELVRVRMRTAHMPDAAGVRGRAAAPPPAAPRVPRKAPETAEALKAPETAELKPPPPASAPPAPKRGMAAAAVGALLVLAVLVGLWAVSRGGGNYAALAEASGGAAWRIDLSKHAVADPAGLVLQEPPAALVYGRRQDAPAVPASVTFTATPRKGDPTWLAVIGPLGVRATTADRGTRVDLVRVQPTLGEAALAAPLLASLEQPPVEVPSGKPLRVEIASGPEGTSVTVNGTRRRVPKAALPDGGEARLGFLLLGAKEAEVAFSDLRTGE